MNNQQLYLAIGIPALIAIFNTGVVITLLLHFGNKLDARMDRLDTRLNRMDTRLDRMDTRLEFIQKDQKEFYAAQRVHDTRLDALEPKKNSS